jgi:hypothetical protein
VNLPEIERLEFFSDGIEADYLAFNSGTHVEISIAAVKGQLTA